VSAEDKSGPLDGVLLPDNDVFRPLLADQREPRFYADYRRIQFRGSSDVLAEGKGRTSMRPSCLRGAFGIWGPGSPAAATGFR